MFPPQSLNGEVAFGSISKTKVKGHTLFTSHSKLFLRHLITGVQDVVRSLNRVIKISIQRDIYQCNFRFDPSLNKKQQIFSLSHRLIVLYSKKGDYYASPAH